MGGALSAMHKLGRFPTNFDLCMLGFILDCFEGNGTPRMGAVYVLCMRSHCFCNFGDHEKSIAKFGWNRNVCAVVWHNLRAGDWMFLKGCDKLFQQTLPNNGPVQTTLGVVSTLHFMCGICVLYV